MSVTGAKVPATGASCWAEVSAAAAALRPTAAIRGKRSMVVLQVSAGKVRPGLASEHSAAVLGIQVCGVSVVRAATDRERYRSVGADDVDPAATTVDGGR